MRIDDIGAGLTFMGLAFLFVTLATALLMLVSFLLPDSYRLLDDVLATKIIIVCVIGMAFTVVPGVILMALGGN